MDLSLKYRPNNFAEIIGQNVVVSILQRQIATKTWKHAYLFCGSHGCGKTSTARIMANEINNGQGEPIEIDGASNKGIENIRKIIADSQQSSIDSEYKIYIIDEAHQLTSAAWDAALKLIEEPPSGAIFILCTTNPDKIPSTILSRVQRFDFRKVPSKDISNRLEFILNEEFDGIEYDKEALDRLSVLSDGHVRDAIKYLDKVLSASDSVTIDVVERIFNLVKSESLVEIADGVCKKNLKKCIVEINKFNDYSENLVGLFDDLNNFFIDCAIYSATKDKDLVGISDEILNKISLSDRYGIVVERMVLYRKHITRSNALLLLKSVLLEVCQ